MGDFEPFKKKKAIVFVSLAFFLVICWVDFTQKKNLSHVLKKMTDENKWNTSQN
jgi:hypothetical protein